MSRRIRTVAVIAAVVALLVFALPLGFAVRRVAVDDERTELQRTADRYAALVSTDAPGGSDPVELPPTESSISVGYYDTEGQLQAGEGPSHLESWAAPTLQADVTASSVDDSLAIAVPVTNGAAVIGTIRAETDLADANGRTWLALAAMAAVAAAAVGIAALVAGRLSKRLAKPLQQLSEDARALGDGDFGRRSTHTGIGDIDDAGKALDDTAIRLGRMIAQERAFNQVASHQLRTPLTALRLILETGRDKSAERMGAAMDEALAAVDRLGAGVDEVLALARADQSSAAALNVAELCERIDQDYRAVLAADGRPLRVQQESHLPEVAAPLGTIGQVLTVLLDNACQHGRGPVEVKLRDAGGALAIDVGDAGDGFDDRTEDAEGLGLPLARTLAESVGGRVILTTATPPIVTLLLPELA